MTTVEPWWANGLLFENCDCASVCPGHISFRQPCNHERCQGYWAFHIEEGAWGDTSLEDLNAFILYDAPQVMAEGNWKQEMYLDQRAGERQRYALEAIFSGEAGSGWAVIAPFFGHREPARYVPIHIEDSGKEMSIHIEGVVQSTVKWIWGK